MKIALITGINGQDGSYLAELLLSKNYIVHGVLRPVNNIDQTIRYERIKHIIDRLHLHFSDLDNCFEVLNLVKKIGPDEIYHLASNGVVGFFPGKERSCFYTNFSSVINFLEALRALAGKIKFYYAGSCTMFGKAEISPQNELSRMNPETPYAIGKLSSYHFIRMYREQYNLFACTGILFNHESPRRGENFLPKKITKAAAAIKLLKQKELILGNIDTVRDWSFAGDVVESMWLMLQQNSAEDFVIGSGHAHSIKELLDIAFGYLDLDWRNYVIQDQSFFRNVDYLNFCADISKANKMLGWKPKINFKELIEMMVSYDYREALIN